MSIPKEIDIELEIKKATRKAALELFSIFPGHFYYFSLITTGEGHPPFISAWSTEALDEVAENEQDKQELKWSYADSPYCCFGEREFSKVESLFSLRPDIGKIESESDRNNELVIRYSAMENALRSLDNEGIFGVGSEREGIVINVEVMPPDHTNTERAKRLNPMSALTTWLNEAAE